MQAPHEPRDGFVDRLEWQISSELRRRHRAGPANWLPASPLRAAALIALVVVVSMAAGGAAVAAAVQAQNSERRQLLAASQELQLKVARERLDLAQQQLQAVERQFHVGLDRPENVQEAQLKVAEAESAVRIIQSRLEEVRLTGAEPLDDISAPRVSGRDFVSERLEAELMVRQRALVIEQRRLRDVKSRVEVGVANQTDLIAVEVRLHEIESALRISQQKLETRRRFVGGDLTATQAARRVLETDAEQRLRALEPKIDLTRKQVADLQRKFEMGLVPRVQVAEARLRLSELEAERAKAQLDLELIRKKGEEPAR